MTAKELLTHYVDIKRNLEDPEKKISRESFSQILGFAPHRQILKHFKTWTAFQEAAEIEFKKSLSPSQRSLLSENLKKFDPNATPDEMIEDLRRVQQDNWGKTITRMFYREHGSFSDSTWSLHFGSFQEFKRQAGLELLRSQHKIEVQQAKAVSLDHYREFFKREVLPYYNKHTKAPSPFHIKTILAMSDLHDRECCEFSLSVFIAECARKQPDVIVLNGDIFDLLEFGRYTVDPRSYDIVGRFDFVRERVFAPLRAACPDAQIDLICGNHEIRLLKLLADATPNVKILLSDVMGLSFKDIFGLDKYEINWASKFDLGAFSKKDLNNEAKKNYQIYFDCFVFTHLPDKRLKVMSGSHGHHHLGELKEFVYLDPVTHMGKVHSWSQTPAMHSKDASYLDNLCGWSTGFLEVIINAKTHEVFQKIHSIQNGWTVIDGNYYQREREDDHE